MSKLIGYISDHSLELVNNALKLDAKQAFTANTVQTETIRNPIYLGKPANDNLEAQKKLTGLLVAQQQLQKLYIELKGEELFEHWDDGDSTSRGYLITNEQMERLCELVGYVPEGGKDA